MPRSSKKLLLSRLLSTSSKFSTFPIFDVSCPDLLPSSNLFEQFRDSEEQVTCRFCWGNEEEDNPLILACKCRGSVGLIHFECLKNWIKT